ncbi:hypothetical protein TNCV_947011 [Trichonephila clavipes]|nr:hypothetical protein TNCV_947011 [Trichonephila clavipes]
MLYDPKVGSGGLEVACLLPKVAGSTPAGVDRFSGYENRRKACHMIMWQILSDLSESTPSIRLLDFLCYCGQKVDGHQGHAMLCSTAQDT